MARRGGVRSVARFKEIDAILKSVPPLLRKELSRRLAVKFTELTLNAYDAGRQVDGSPRPLGVRGNKLTLVKTGETRRGLKWFASGGRVKLNAAGAAQYLGKYGILPPAWELPPGWLRWAKIIGDEVLRGLVKA